MEIYMFIALALRVLPRLDPLVYPNLCYYRDKTTVIKHLEAVLHLFESQERPVVTIDGKAFFLFSQRYMRQWSKDEADCGGTHERWQSHKIFLMDLGLIETYTVTGQSDNPVLTQIWNKAKEKKQNCEQLWTIPFYDDDLLQQAERIAGLYHEYGINIAHLRKNVVIRFRGQKRANWLYADRRVINQAEKTMLEYCRTAIRLATAHPERTEILDYRSEAQLKRASQKALLKMQGPFFRLKKSCFSSILSMNPSGEDCVWRYIL